MKFVLIKDQALTVDGEQLERWVYTQPLMVLEETQSAVLVKYVAKISIAAWFDKSEVYRWF